MLVSAGVFFGCWPLGRSVGLGSQCYLLLVDISICVPVSLFLELSLSAKSLLYDGRHGCALATPGDRFSCGG